MVVTISLFLLFCYSIVVLLLLIGVLLPDQTAVVSKTAMPTLLSIVIPCKNEENNIAPLLASLLQQEYPHALEILFVNDGSTDLTAAEIRKAVGRKQVTIRIIDSVFNPTYPLTSKQQALDLGIRQAKSNYVITTDADMTFSSGWLHSLTTAAVHHHAHLVYGHTAIIRYDKNIFPLLQQFQLSFLFAVAYALQKIGVPGSCMGNNMLILKNAYLESGGFNAIGHTITEDRALLLHFSKKGKKVTVATPFTPAAFTYAIPTLTDFLQQAQRWIIGGFNHGSNLFLIALVFTFQNILVVLSASGKLPHSITVAALGNFMLTWLFIGLTFRKNGAPASSLQFPLYFLFLLGQSVILPFLLLFNRGIRWKDRVIVQ